MELREIGEFGLIGRIRERYRNGGSGIHKGMGDDAAVTSLTPGLDLVSTVDLLVEDIHFDLSLLQPDWLGRKSLAVNLSDIAAMGATPRFALVCLAIPPRISVEFLDEFYRGLFEIARAHHTALIGGDTCSSPDKLYISISLLGEGSKERLIYRDGAQVGDQLFVTGTLGDSILGLALAKKYKGEPSTAEEAFLRKRHFDPTPRIREGQILAQKGLARAMIDISDGLLSDLGHICEESQVGAVIWAERIPQSAAFQSLVPPPKERGWQMALQGGEDYELLLATPPERASALREMAQQEGWSITQIGEILPKNSGVRVFYQNQPVEVTHLKGYDHFKSPFAP